MAFSATDKLTMNIHIPLLVLLSTSFLYGCVASTKQLTNRLDMTLNTSLSIEEVSSLEKYGITSKEELRAAYNEAKKYGFSESYWGIVNLEKSKLAAKQKGISLETYQNLQKQLAKAAAEKRRETLGYLRVSNKYDDKLNLKEPIFLTCSRISKNSYGDRAKSLAYVILRNKSMDYIAIWNRFNTGVAGKINEKDSFYDKPITVEKFTISSLKNGSAYSDKRNNISINRTTLKLTHNEYIDYTLGKGRKPLYPNNTYSYDCDLSSPERAEWQKSQNAKFYTKQLKEGQDKKQRLEQRLKERKI